MDRLPFFACKLSEPEFVFIIISQNIILKRLMSGNIVQNSHTNHGNPLYSLFLLTSHRKY